MGLIYVTKTYTERTEPISEICEPHYISYVMLLNSYIAGASYVAC